MSAHTPGPWKVYERRLPYVTPKGNRGEHVEHTIGTSWIHGQLKGPAPVVTLSMGLGDESTKAHYFVSTSKADADRIVQCVNSHDQMLEALQLAQGVLFLLSGEVKALGCHAENVPEKVHAAIAAALPPSAPPTQAQKDQQLGSDK